MNFFPKLFGLDVSVLSDSMDEKKMTLEASCWRERVNLERPMFYILKFFS